MSTTIQPQAILVDQGVVHMVRVVVHTLGSAGPTISDNHWSIYLILDGGESVRINMTAEPGYIDGYLDWTKQNYTLTRSAIRCWDFQAVQGLQVHHIANLIYQLRRDRYNMSGGGSGCRYWV
jgi:hypothetical protein